MSPHLREQYQQGAPSTRPPRVEICHSSQGQDDGHRDRDADTKRECKRPESQHSEDCVDGSVVRIVCRRGGQSDAARDERKPESRRGYHQFEDRQGADECSGPQHRAPSPMPQRHDEQQQWEGLESNANGHYRSEDGCGTMRCACSRERQRSSEKQEGRRLAEHHGIHDEARERDRREDDGRRCFWLARHQALPQSRHAEDKGEHAELAIHERGASGTPR